MAAGRKGHFGARKSLTSQPGKQSLGSRQVTIAKTNPAKIVITVKCTPRQKSYSVQEKQGTRERYLSSLYWPKNKLTKKFQDEQRKETVYIDSLYYRVQKKKITGKNQRRKIITVVKIALGMIMFTVQEEQRVRVCCLVNTGKVVTHPKKNKDFKTVT